jgi:hypothetical protein
MEVSPGIIPPWQCGKQMTVERKRALVIDRPAVPLFCWTGGSGAMPVPARIKRANGMVVVRPDMTRLWSEIT